MEKEKNENFHKNENHQSRGISTKISMEIIVQKERKWMPYISYCFTYVLGYEVHGFMYRYLKCLNIHLFVYMRIIYDK